MTAPWVYEERVVAFVDILGYKHLATIPEEEAKRLVQLVSESFSKARFADQVNFMITSAAQQFSARAFSDCIYLSDEVTAQGTRNVVSQAAGLAHDLAVNGIYVRGGVTTGLHYQDLNIVFGEGIGKAYHLEQFRAKHPRILVDPAVATRLPEAAKYLVARDNDGESFIDYWSWWPWDYSILDYDLASMSTEQKYAARLEAFRAARAQLLRNREAAARSHTSSLMAKLEWVRCYHNMSAESSLTPADAPGITVPAESIESRMKRIFRRLRPW